MVELLRARTSAFVFAGFCFFAAISLPVSCSQAASNLGIGALYNMPSGEIEGTGLDNNYFSYMLSIRQPMGPGRNVEFSIDYYPGKEGIDHVLRPSVCIIWGDLLNFGLGVSRSYIKEQDESGEWADISYQIQGGIKFPLTREVWLSVDAFYFASRFKDIKDIDANYLTLGSRIFFRF